MQNLISLFYYNRYYIAYNQKYYLQVEKYKYMAYESDNQNFKNSPAEFNIHATVQSIELLEQ